MLESLLRSVALGAALLCLAASVYAPRIPSFLFFTFSIIPLSLFLFLPLNLSSRRRFSHLTPRYPASLPFPERIWCLLAGFSPFSRFLLRYASVGAMWNRLEGRRQRHRMRHKLLSEHACNVSTVLGTYSGIIIVSKSPRFESTSVRRQLGQQQKTFESHETFLSLQPMIPPKRLKINRTTRWMLRRFRRI